MLPCKKACRQSAAAPMRTCARPGQLSSLRSFRPFTAAPPLPHPRASTVAGFAGSRRAFAGSALLAGLAMFGGRLRGMSAAAAQQSVEKALEEPNWPESWPFSGADFQRYDESKDERFYDAPRFVTHIDDGAIAALTRSPDGPAFAKLPYVGRYYQEVFPPSGSKDAAILDLCSSWISHYPPGYSAGRVAGLGMNMDELARNPVLTERVVHDLNADPMLPYEDNAFDVITNTVSVDYLTKPKEVFAEMHRVLKPGGVAVMSFSNRCFPTKAISIWTSTGDSDHVWIVGAYFHFSVPGGWTRPAAADITPGPVGGAVGAWFGARGDPMYVVSARKVEA